MARNVLVAGAVKSPLLVLLVLAVAAACGATPPDPVEIDGIDDPGSPIPDPIDDAAVTAATAVVESAGCVAHASLAGHSTWLFFTRPDRPCKGEAGSGIDTNAVDELTRLIGTVPAGARIDGHIFSITIDAVAKALLDAEARGVEVWLSTDGEVAASTDASKTQYLDKLTHKVYCTHSNNTACIATADGAISHTKLFVFSTATAPDGVVGKNVVWFGSANQTYASGAKLYNNTVTVYGDAALYTKLQAYLGDLFAQDRRADYYDSASGRGYLLADAADVYVSPETQTDLVVNRLNDITPDDQCRVRVMQASVRDSRMDVVDQLIAMKRGGCHMWVVSDTVEPDALAALKAASIPVHHMPIHDKAFLVYGNFGGTYEYRAYSGSHNLSGSSAHKFDEIFVKLAPETGTVHPVYDAYFTHFNDAYNTGPAL